jgi:hypothetical protein
MIGVETNDMVILYDRGVCNQTKLHVYAGYFASDYHGKVEIDEDWWDKCDVNAWMIRDPIYHQPQSEVERKIVKHRLFAYCSDDEELLHDARITHSWKRQC